MYFKIIRKYIKAKKTSHYYFRLCESYRDEHRTVRQRMVLGLGRLLELPDFDQRALFITSQRVDSLDRFNH